LGGIRNVPTCALEANKKHFALDNLETRDTHVSALVIFFLEELRIWLLGKHKIVTISMRIIQTCRERERGEESDSCLLYIS